MKVKSNLDEVIYQKFIESLIRGEYTLGEQIQLNDICDKFEVSRTPVVQAVKMLNKDGVLQIMSNGRAYVPEYGLEMVEQICESRIVIELYALEKWLNGNAEEFRAILADVKRCAQMCQMHYENHERVEMTIADLALHKAIVAGARNSVLIDLFKGIQGRFVVVNYLMHSLDDRDYEGTIQDHDEMIALMEQGHKEEAVAHLRRHIEKTIERFNKYKK